MIVTEILRFDFLEWLYSILKVRLLFSCFQKTLLKLLWYIKILSFCLLTEQQWIMYHYSLLQNSVQFKYKHTPTSFQMAWKKSPFPNTYHRSAKKWHSHTEGIKVMVSYETVIYIFLYIFLLMTKSNCKTVICEEPSHIQSTISL